MSINTHQKAAWNNVGIKIDFAITGYPLSRDFREQLETSLGVPLVYFHLTELRHMPFLRMIRKLRSLKGKRVIVPLEDISSRAILPILMVVAAVTATRQIEVVYPDLRRECINRGKAVRLLLGISVASVKGALAALACRKELIRLSRVLRIPVKIGDGWVLYLKTNFWFGIKVGGSVGHIAGVVNGLARRGYSVTFAAPEPPVMVDEAVTYLSIQLPRVFGLPFELNHYRFQKLLVRQLWKAMQHSSPAFIYQRLSVANYAGVVISRALRVPLVLEYNGSEVWVAKNWSRPLRYNRLATLAEEVCLKHAHLIVTVSDALKDELIERGIEPERIVSYPNCIDPTVFDPARFQPSELTDLKRKHGVQPEAVLVTFIGTFGQWHGVDVLAETIQRMVDEDEGWLRRKRVHFMLVGDGLKRPEVERILSGERYRLFFTLTGLIPQAEAPKYLAASDIFVSPHIQNPDGSRFFGSPTKLFEYMAMGKGIVASDLEQIGMVLRHSLKAEALPDGNVMPNGEYKSILARPGDVKKLAAGIRFLIENPPWREYLGHNARQEALAKYTWERHVGAVLQRLATLPVGEPGNNPVDD